MSTSRPAALDTVRDARGGELGQASGEPDGLVLVGQSQRRQERAVRRA